jgi:nucleoside-diphosphate-sugar epimerase
MFTILGSTGFIGGRLATALRRQGHEVYAPARGDPEVFRRDLGDVIYAIGLTADFRGRPFDTVEAHVCLLRNLLQSGKFQSLLYLSSTRIYNQDARAEEGQSVNVNPANPEELYNLSKLMGESLCVATGRDSVRVARLSNVYGGDYGSENFLTEVLRQALLEGRVRLRQTLDSAKDYIGVVDVVAVLPRIALSGKARLYNIASGRSVSHRELLAGLSRLVPLSVEVEENAPALAFPPISIERAKSEFGFAPNGIMTDLPAVVAEFRKAVPAK